MHFAEWKLSIQTNNVALLWCSSFLSVLGSFVFTIALTSSVYESTGNASGTALILTLQVLAGIILIFIGGKHSDATNVRVALIASELVSFLVTILMLPFLQPLRFGPVLALIFIRGFSELLAKSLRATAINVYFFPDSRSKVAPMMQSAYYLGIGIAGVCGALMGKLLSLTAIAVLDGLTFVASAAIVAFLKPISAQVPQAYDSGPLKYEGVIASFSASIKGRPALLHSCIALGMTAMLLQGTFSVIQSILPIKQFSLGRTGVSILFSATSAAIFLGTLAYRFADGKKRISGLPSANLFRLSFILSMFCGAFFLLEALSASFFLSAMFHFLLVLTYELIFMGFYVQITLLTPNGRLGRLILLIGTVTMVGQGFVGCIVGSLIDHGFSFSFVTGLVSASLSCVLLLFVFASQKAHSSPVIAAN